MQKLYKDKKANSFNFFLLITAVPIIGIIIIFSFIVREIQGNIEFTLHEQNGLTIIEEIQKSVLSIQKIRGLTSIETPNSASLNKLELMKKDIVISMDSLEKKLSNINSNAVLKKELLSFIGFVKETKLETLSFDELTQIVKQFIAYSSRISYHCKLILDSDLDISVLINNVVFLFIDIIEHNGQIRGVAVSTTNGKIDFNQRHSIIMQIDKIEEELKKLDFNIFLLGEVAYDEKLKASYKNMKETQKAIIDFTKKELLKDDGRAIEANGVFEQITKNIDSLIVLYDVNLNMLKKGLETRLHQNREKLLYYAFFSFLSILFIIIINRIFYLKNRDYIDKIEELTITDGMTSLYNRRYFDDMFDNYLKINQRMNQVPIFIILDIDYFKEYNDTYGHQAGDVAIKTVAKIVQTSLKRASDMAFRLGGEEFGILCSGVSKSEALHLAQSIRENIENEKIEHKNSKTNDYLTISMGIIVIEQDKINSTREIYRCADRALYKAKEDGRNQVVLYDAKLFCDKQI